MSIMDDYFDARHYLRDGSAKELWEHRKFCADAFERLWDAFCKVEEEAATARSTIRRVQKGQDALKVLLDVDLS